MSRELLVERRRFKLYREDGHYELYVDVAGSDTEVMMNFPDFDDEEYEESLEEAAEFAGYAELVETDEFSTPICPQCKIHMRHVPTEEHSLEEALYVCDNCDEHYPVTTLAEMHAEHEADVAQMANMER